MAKALDAEILEQRKAAGLIDYRDDILDILIDVAPFADGITIDGKTYQQFKKETHADPRRKELYRWCHVNGDPYYNPYARTEANLLGERKSE